MPAPVAETVFLLPERRRFSGQALSRVFAKRLGRADRLPDASPGECEQLLRYFDLLPRGWPMAAITRQFEAGDAAAHGWLRADPVHVRPDMGGARLLAWGNLQLTDEEARGFLKPLMPLFGDAGFEISATAPERWHVRLPPEAKLPSFVLPAQALGEDLLKHLPEGPEGRRWRSLLTEAQIILHNHPLNVARAARGLLPVNSLWFWGGGVLPTSVRSAVGMLVSDDLELRALAALVIENVAVDGNARRLVDLRDQRQWSVVEAAVVNAGAQLQLDFSDGVRWRIDAGQGWRFWRRPAGALA